MTARPDPSKKGLSSGFQPGRNGINLVAWQNTADFFFKPIVRLFLDASNELLCLIVGDRMNGNR